MPNTIRLPDAMPDVTKPTLLVVCDSHHCRLLDVGGHAIVEKETVTSVEAEFSDKQGQTRSPASMATGGGMVSGMGDMNPVDEHRLKTFANDVIKHLEQSVRAQKIESVHISAPAKFLSVLRSHMTPTLSKVLTQSIDGNFVKESPLQILVRFRPDLKEAVKALRDQENYSPAKQPPKK
jgi:protein required for attachment to host cells